MTTSEPERQVGSAGGRGPHRGGARRAPVVARPARTGSWSRRWSVSSPSCTAAASSAVLELVSDDDVERLVADDLVGSLLILHGLHPLDLEARVVAALDSVRPYLGSHGGDVEVLGIDEDEGVLHLRMLGSCDGCPSSSVTLQQAVKQAIEEAAPEIVHIDVVDDTPPPPRPLHPVVLTEKPVRSA